MANIKKNFNFRNGVQVDDDNLLVTSTGLVGIGTTVPTEALDVRGNVNITGFCSFTTANIGIMTISTIKASEIIGAGVSIKSGIVTAEGAGIVTYYGDARFLQGMPTSQWQDIDVGLGFTSIYNTGGNVGIATTDPRASLQIGGDVDSSQEGVGISSVGNIKATGIVTATSFIGALTGNVTGNVTGDLTGNSTGNLTGLVNSTGISTFVGINATGRIVGAATSNVIPFFYSNLSDLPSAVTYHGAFAHVHATGRGYYAHGGNWIELVNKDTSGNLSQSGDLDVDGHTNLDNASISGVSTFNGDVTFTGDNYDLQWDKSDDSLEFGDNTFAVFGGQGDLKIRHNATVSPNVSQISGSPLEIISDDLVLKSSTGDKSYLTTTVGGATTLFNDGNEKLRTTGFGVTVFNQLDTTNIVASGIITASTELNSPLIGVGTDAPANPIQVRGTGNTEIQVTSDTGVAGLTLGRESGTNNTNNAEFRYGGGSGAPYSSAQSLDIINYGTGNFNYHISANNPSAAEGDYHWHKGINSGKLMTLTNTGRLGIGETQPNETLTVSGVCTITANSFVGGNFFVVGNSTIGGDVSIGGNLIIPSINTNITGNLTGSVFGNVNIFSGISTFKKVGVNTTVCFDSLDFDGINALGAFKRLGIGQTQPDGILDVSGEDSNPVKKFILLPQVSAGSTSVIQAENPVGGGLIYNTTLRKLQFYNGTNWETVTSVEVTG